MNNKELMELNIAILPISPLDAYITAISSAIQIALQEHSKAIRENPTCMKETRGTARILDRLRDYGYQLDEYRKTLTKLSGAK